MTRASSNAASSRANPIDVVEAAYDLESNDRDWLRAVAEAVRPVIDGGAGVHAYYFDVETPATTWVEEGISFDLEPTRLRQMIDLVLENPDITRALHVDPQPLAAAVEGATRCGLGDVHPFFAPLGLRDFVALRTIEPGGRGICITAGQTSDRTLGPRSQRLWARVSAHIAAARRLRAALATHAQSSRAPSSQAPSSEAESSHAEAVLTPAGRIDHAEGAGTPRQAREVLREAVLQREQARGRMRKTDPERATEGWTALVGGRWSLVDQFEANGRRYIVARRNEHTLTDPRALSPRERAVAHLAALGKSNKLIAYELGIASSTVGGQLSAAMRKLGVSSRTELIRHLVGVAADAR